jgi:hypothetical protein
MTAPVNLIERDFYVLPLELSIFHRDFQAQHILGHFLS